jgi:hypothetical protein
LLIFNEKPDFTSHVCCYFPRFDLDLPLDLKSVLIFLWFLNLCTVSHFQLSFQLHQERMLDFLSATAARSRKQVRWVSVFLV